MTHTALLEALQSETIEAVKDILLPVKGQKSTADTERSPEVYLMRLPDSHSAKAKAPYILHQVITSKDSQQAGKLEQGSANIRTIFCIYCKDEQEGGLRLLNLIERLRITMLRKVVIAGQFQLDLEAGLEWMIYPEDTAPYYAGEMSTVWKMPAIQREVDLCR